MYPLLNMVIFHCHVGFLGVSIPFVFRGCKLTSTRCFLGGERKPCANLSNGFTPPKTKTISIGGTSSNHWFSGDMLVFQGVSSPPLWIEECMVWAVCEKNRIPPKILLGLPINTNHVPWFFLGSLKCIDELPEISSSKLDLDDPIWSVWTKVSVAIIFLPFSHHQKTCGEHHHFKPFKVIFNRPPPKNEGKFCWWKKSQTTTWDVKHPWNNGINYQPQLVSRISSINNSLQIITMASHFFGC